MTTRPQNYVKYLETIDSYKLDHWNALTDEMWVAQIAGGGNSVTLAVPNYVNCCEIIINAPLVYFSLEGVIPAVPDGFTKVNYRLLNNQTHNVFYLESDKNNLYFRNENTTEATVSVVFARTKNQLGDTDTAGRPCGDFC